MALLARDVVSAARDRHPSFTRAATPDAVALRALARYQQRLLGRIFDERPDVVHEAQDVELPLDDFEEGIELDEHLQVHGATAYYREPNLRPLDVRLVEYPLRHARLGGPGAYVRAGTMFLLGIPADWRRFEKVTIDLFPRGPESLRPRDELILPGQASPPCEAAVALLMARRADPELGIQTVEFREELAEEEELYLDQVTRRRRAVVSIAREVW